MSSTPLFTFRVRTELLENPDGLRLWYAVDAAAETGPVELDAEEAMEIAGLWERMVTLVGTARKRAEDDSTTDQTLEDRAARRFTDPFALRPKRDEKP